MPNAAIYARISSDRDGDQLGVKRQLADCEALAERKQWTVAGHYVDDDISAYSDRPRPEYRRMLDDISNGVVDAVIVWHLDRLHRQPRELEEFFEVCDRAGVRWMASFTGDVDLSTDDGRFMARILGAVARKESDDKSRRIKRKHLELAHEGKRAGGGTRGYGHEADGHTIREDEAANIREWAERFLAGESIRSICGDLNARHIPTVTGVPWRTQVLRRLLMSGRISGQREHNGEIVAQGDWPAIITQAQTARIRAILADPSRRTNRSARRYLLTRLLRCGRCGATLVARPRDDGRRRYVCAKGPNFDGCNGTMILSDELEAFVVDAVLYRLDSPQLAASLNGDHEDDESERWHAEADRAAAQLEELASIYGAGTITMAEWLAARQPLEHRLSAARRKLAATTRTAVIGDHVGNGGALREAWPSLPLTRQREIVASVLDHLVVGPGRRGYNRFDPTRLTPAWRV